MEQKQFLIDALAKITKIKGLKREKWITLSEASGVTVRALRSYIADENGTNYRKMPNLVRIAIINAVKDAEIEQIKQSFDK
jgi:hypothetical protein